MGTIRWVIINALAITIIHAAPRELSSDELITEPRPGEEYVNIQTSQNNAKLAEQSFTTSHRIPQRKITFETSHKVPPSGIQTREFSKKSARLEPELADNLENLEASKRLPRYDNPDGEPSSDRPVEVVTRTSVKMSKSKKVQKAIAKPQQEVELDIKSNEGLIDETAFADGDVKEVMAVKYMKNENGVEDKKPLRFNVPFEDEEEVTGKSEPSMGLSLNSTAKAPTTPAPPITTFNYKNAYETSKKVKEAIQQISGKSVKGNADKLKNEILPVESIKAAESRASQSKKEAKHEKKIKLTKKEEHGKQDGDFYVLPVNKVTSQVPEDNYDFVDLDEKVLESAGSSPGQSSRINIKKGPNGQEYEYVYYYYYYDDDDEGKGNGGAKGKEEKAQTSTTEKIYNGHDGPAVDARNDNENAKSSTSGSRYLPTENPKFTQKSRKKTQQDDFPGAEERDESPEAFRGSNDGTRYASFNRQPEPVNNEVLPTTRLQSRSRGRVTNVAGANPVPADDIPSIGEERLPANTRFPPRSRNNSPTSPQPQETTTRTRNRESNSQSRVRLPNLGLLDSSSFRTHSSDASIDEDPIHDAELHRRPTSRTFSTEATDAKKDEITTLAHRRIRPTTPSTIITTPRTSEDSEVPPQRRLINRRPVDERIPFEDDEEEEEENVEKVEKGIGDGRLHETTRESDAEEGDFVATKTPHPNEKESSEVKAYEITTEDESVVGLTSAMMEKVALDLYAILQQAQNENIQTNFVDGNSTDITTEEEVLTEVTTFSTTTSTTTETTTTLATTTPAPATAPGGRPRYRTRGGVGGGLPKSRAKTTTTTTTTEIPAEPTSQRTRGRFQPNANRGNSQATSRRVTKPKVEVEESVTKEAPKPAPERTFGGRNRFRGTKSTTTTTTTTSSPTTISGAAAISGSRGSSVDRYNARRRGSRLPVSTTSQPTAEDNLEIERQEAHQEGNVQGSLEETTAGISLKPNIRNRVNAAGARPLRPGPRVPLNLAQKGRLPSTTTSAPVEAEIGSADNKDAADLEQPTLQDEEEPVVTPPSDPLSRLKNRPRLRIGPTSSQQRIPSQSPVTPSANRKKLVSSLLPKRKGGEDKAVEKVEETGEERNEEEIYDEETSPSSTEPSTTTEADNKGLSGLLNGRRRNLVRRPGTIYSRSQQTEAS